MPRRFNQSEQIKQKNAEEGWVTISRSPAWAAMYSGVAAERLAESSCAPRPARYSTTSACPHSLAMPVPPRASLLMSPELAAANVDSAQQLRREAE